jgi:catechol 2,3-dioxygenase-like lactoylglutathione lyase family enzyme
MRNLLLLSCAAAASTAFGQSIPAHTEPAFVARGAFFAVSVPDVEASAKWYADKLGLAVTLRPPKQDESTAIILEGGGLIVELIQRDDAVPLRQAAPSVAASYQVHGIFKAGVIVDDFDKTLATLRSRGVAIAIGPFAATKTQRANVIIRDNAGNYIQLFGPDVIRTR